MARTSALRSLVGCVVLGLAGFALSACGSASPNNGSALPSISSLHLTGFGATTAAWNNAHGPPYGTAGDQSYGPIVASMASRQFAVVEFSGDRVVSYLEYFAVGSSLKSAKATMLRAFPKDTTTVKTVIATKGSDQGCALWELSSKAIASIATHDPGSGLPNWSGDRSGKFVVEFNIAALGHAFTANNVTTGTVQAGPLSAGQGC